MKKLVFGEEARQKLKSGVDTVANAVKVTLGPSGRNVVISDFHGDNPQVTKDGVSVAKSIQVEDPLENVGVEMIKGVARKTVNDAGDGTTTATVLAQSMVKHGLDAVRDGFNPMDIKRGMDKAVAIVVAKIKEISKKVDGDVEKIKNIATISANNDAVIGGLIAEAFAKIGDNGVISIKESHTADTTIEVVDGMKIDKGYISKHFITDPEKLESVMEDVCVVVTDYDITMVSEIRPILDALVPSGKPILFVCGDMSQEALSFITINKLQGRLKASAVKPSSAYRSETLADIATLTGAVVISDSIGIKLESVTPDMIGRCGKVISTDTTTVFIEGKGKPADLKVRMTEIKSAMAKATNDFDRERLTQRLARISGSVAIMSVGAATEMEMSEKIDRVDDAIRATKSAIEEGVVAGGGSCLLSCIDNLNTTAFLNKGEQAGACVVAMAMSSPMKQILENCGIEVGVIVSSVQSGEHVGFNAKSMQFEDLFETGVIDPAKVVRVALENACSIAGMIITCECLDAEIHRKGPIM